MDYLQKLKQDIEAERKFNEWTIRRKELVHQVTDFYNTKGSTFARDLEKLIQRYESRPTLNGTETRKLILKRKK